MMRGTPRRRGGRAWVWLVAGLLAGGAIGAGTMYILNRGKSGIPGGPRLGEAKELAMVPADATGFIHVRARDIWKSEYLTEFRKAVDKAGPDSLKILDEGFVPAPSTLDRMTVVFLRGGDAVTPKGLPPKGFPKGAPPVPMPKGGPPMLPGGLDLPFDAPSSTDFANSVVILAFNEPFDSAKVRNTYMPQGTSRTIDGKEVWQDKAADLGLYFSGETIMVIGPAGGVEQFVAKQKDTQPAGPLSAALKTAAEGGRHVVGGFNVAKLGMPEPNFERADPEFKALEKEIRSLMKVEAVALGVAFTPEGTKIDVRASYKNDEDAAAADSAVRAIAAVGRKKLDEPKKQMKAMLDGKPGHANPRPIKELPEAVMGLMGVGALNLLDEHLANPAVKVEASELVVTFESSSIGGAYVGVVAVGVGLLLPATQKVREAAARMTGSNNLKQIGIAMHNYHDLTGHFPPPALTVGTTGPKPGGLSWRVHLLPYLDQQALYQQFKLNESWDGPNNKKLIPMMPKVYQSPSALAAPGQTYYKVFAGADNEAGAAFFPGSKTTIVRITDGTSNTIMTIEGGAAVTWTKPDDVVFDQQKPLPDLKLAGNPKVLVGLFDGSVRTIDLNRLSPDVLKAAITPAGGEILPPDWFDQK